MAQRIGKYKVSKKESALSLADGGTINGALSIIGTPTSGVGVASNQVFLTGSNCVSQSGGKGGTESEINLLCIAS